MKPRIAPSILSADFSNLETEMASIAEADLIHVDVMDGHFVPNLTLGLPVVERLAAVSKTPLDVHLMIDDPDQWAPKYAAVGAYSVTFHIEAATDPEAIIDAIRASGAKAALAIKPATDVESVLHLLAKVDMLLVMTVEPGFGGQLLIESCIPKVAVARQFAIKNQLILSIQVDGGITDANIKELAEAGADTFVAGTAVFKAKDRNQQIRDLRDLAITL